MAEQTSDKTPTLADAIVSFLEWLLGEKFDKSSDKDKERLEEISSKLTAIFSAQVALQTAAQTAKIAELEKQIADLKGAQAPQAPVAAAKPKVTVNLVPAAAAEPAKPEAIKMSPWLMAADVSAKSSRKHIRKERKALRRRLALKAIRAQRIEAARAKIDFPPQKGMGRALGKVANVGLRTSEISLGLVPAVPLHTVSLGGKLIKGLGMAIYGIGAGVDAATVRGKRLSHDVISGHARRMAVRHMGKISRRNIKRARDGYHRMLSSAKKRAGIAKGRAKHALGVLAGMPRAAAHGALFTGMVAAAVTLDKLSSLDARVTGKKPDAAQNGIGQGAA